MQTGDYVRITIDTYDGKESMYGRIGNISFAMGIYSEPIYEVATENDKSLFDAKELEYVRGPFYCSEYVTIADVPYRILQGGNISNILLFNSYSYLEHYVNEFVLLSKIYGPAAKSEYTSVAVSHKCTFVVWPMDYNKSACRECGAWQVK